MSSISRFINYLYCWIYSIYTVHEKLNKTIQELDWPFISFWNLKAFYFSLSLSLSLSLICFLSLYYSLSFAVTHCDFFSLVGIRCNSLSLVVIPCYWLSLVVIRFRSLYHLLSLVVTWYITCLSFINDL